MKTFSSTRRALFGVLVALPSLILVSWPQSHISNASSGKLATVDSSKVLLKGLVYDRDYLTLEFLGFNSKSEGVFNIDNSKNGRFILVTPSGMVKRNFLSPKYDFGNTRLSSDGKVIFTTGNLWAQGLAGFLNNLVCLDATTLQEKKRIYVNRSRANVFRASPLFQDKVIVPLLEWTWSAELKDYVNDYTKGCRIEVWDWKKAKRERSLLYPQAPGAAAITFSPDGKYIACIFKDQDKERFTPFGVLDILDARTGKTTWHIVGRPKQPLRLPFAFIRPHQMVCSNVIYDLDKHTIMPLFPVGNAKAQLVGSIPQ